MDITWIYALGLQAIGVIVLVYVVAMLGAIALPQPSAPAPHAPPKPRA